MFILSAEKLRKLLLLVILSSNLTACYDPKVSRYGAIPVDYYHQYAPPTFLMPTLPEPEAEGYGKYKTLKSKKNRQRRAKPQYPQANLGYMQRYNNIIDNKSPRYYSKYNSTY